MASCVFNVSLRPTAVLRNLLPVPLVCESGRGQEEIVAPGGHLHLASVEPGTSAIVLRLDNYLEKVWSCKHDVQAQPPELGVWSFDSYDSSARMTLDLGMHTIMLHDTLYLSLYAPFWMINKTGLSLSYRQSEDSTNVLYHPPNFEGPVLFSFRPKAFFGKKKACVKIEDSDWSNKFSLDVAGSSGSISCKANKQQYQIGVSIQLAHSNLTKLVTFTPYYLLVNHAPYDIECQEGDRPADPWTLVESGECSSLWPQGVGNRDHTLRLRVRGTTEMTPPFSFNQNHATLLKLHNKFGGISVDVQVSEGAIYINMSAYQTGLAPALIINHTNCTVEFWEKSSDPSIKKLAPMEQALYTWENPSGARLLIWNTLSANSKKEETADMLRKDGLGRLWLPSGQKDVYWVSFLDGMQRVLLFTASPEVARDAQAAADLEPVETEVALSSGVIWEWKKPNKNKWEALSSVDCALLEEAYMKGHSNAILSDGATADLELLQVLKRQLRRTYHPGVWLSLRSSKHQQQLHFKLHTLQIDCPRPYVEISVVKRLLEHSTVQQFRYLRVLVQEFHVKLDMGFLGALLDLFSTDESLEIDHTEKMAGDMQVVTQPLKALVAVQSAQEQKNFYDQLHLSPLKIHLSFSMSSSGAGVSKSGNARLNVLNALLQNVGVTLTDLQDVVFRQLMQEVTSHYTQQGVKQLYVLVLGLDVIGNPFGLVLGLKQGVEDLFYEPIQGAIQGPGEFAEGLKNGVRSLLGHTLSGTAAAMSRITGTVGKTLANLSFDEEYQRRRREQQMNRPTALHEGLVQSGKGLVTGVFSGVTGVITKPISGAQNEGVGGFFKGIGAGVIGLVTQPTGGVIDFASNTLDTVKRAADTADEIKPLRSPRYFPSGGLITPYSHSESFGNRLLSMVDKGRYAKTDYYVHHAAVGGRKEVVLLTDKRIMLVSRNDLFGQWQTEWHYPWLEMPKAPTLTTVGLQIHTGEPQKKVMGLFKSSEAVKTLVIADENEKQRIFELASKIINEKMSVPKSPQR
ncbi:hypothetical protein B566_EDAN017925 [Ephemera danica]|nr:hypothetical protein B566_EDAN017925 [Ephemera danica]